MRKKEIEKRFNTIISNSVPDVLNDVLAKCEKKKGFNRKVDVMKREVKLENRNKYLIPKIAGVLAIVMVCVGGAFVFNQYNKLYRTDSIINFDVNPSIELKVNKDEEIIKVIPLNDDGVKILDGMDFDRVDLDVAVNAIIGSMLKNGYISALENSILVSVKNDNVEKANKIKEEITNDINEILNASSINASILSQAYADDTDAKKLASENEISEGKARLINNVLNSDIKDSKGKVYTFESLSKLSINELNLLLASKNTDIKDTSTTGTASESAYIGKTKAKNIAFKDAGVSSSKVTDLEAELDADDGVLVYEVDFNFVGTEYEYEINAKTGDIIHKNTEKDDDYKVTNSTTTKPSTTQSTNTTSGNSYIGKTKAKQIAFSDAGVSSSSVRDLEVELDEDDGKYVYEITFESENVEYEYKINAKTGKIIDKEIDKDNGRYDD